jgi:hypothetical protein
LAAQFFSREPTTEEYWRAIILFGRNVASYKFALAKAMLQLRPASGYLMKLEDLAEPFALHVAEHLRKARQGQFKNSRFLNACKAHNEGALDRNQLIEQTVRYGFNKVIDAFHVVGQEAVAERFFHDERGENGGIRITDRFSMLLAGEQFADLPLEVEARWRLVETAWELGIPRQLLVVSHDATSESLFVVDGSRRRRSVTGSRDALNGYQKGRCFYCDGDIHIGDRALLPDVDHFFPHALKGTDLGPAVDQVWNLVLACRNCNRGPKGKFDRLPSTRLLARLYERNEFLISSHHPLREVLRAQTGAEASDRRDFLNHFHQSAVGRLVHLWDPVPLATVEKRRESQ